MVCAEQTKRFESGNVGETQQPSYKRKTHIGRVTTSFELQKKRHSFEDNNMQMLAREDCLFKPSVKEAIFISMCPQWEMEGSGTQREPHMMPFMLVQLRLLFLRPYVCILAACKWTIFFKVHFFFFLMHGFHWYDSCSAATCSAENTVIPDNLSSQMNFELYNFRM